MQLHVQMAGSNAFWYQIMSSLSGSDNTASDNKQRDWTARHSLFINLEMSF